MIEPMMSSLLSRREFLKRSSALSVAGTAAPWAVSLAALGEAAAATATDYKAIVCVFLYGGNDYGNTVIPYDTPNYALYQALRPTLAYAQADLAGTLLNPTDPMLYWLCPVLPKATDAKGRDYEDYMSKYAGFEFDWDRRVGQ